MRLPVFVHQFDSGYADNGLGSDDTRLPLSEVWGKTNDGLTWMAQWDGHPAAIGSLDAVVRTERDVYAPQGIDYRPWGVVHGRWPGVADCARNEGRMAGEIARAAAGPGQAAVYIVDLEPSYHAPFPAFWRDDLGAGADDVRAFVEGFTSAGGEQLWLCPDARIPHLAPVAFEAWASHPCVTRVVPQVYFTDFVRPRNPGPEDVRTALDAALGALATHGWYNRASVWPALPGDADPERMCQAILEAHGLGCGGVAVWQRANLRPDTAAAIASLDDPWAVSSAPPATPAPPPEVPAPAPYVDAPAALMHVRAARNALDSAEGAAGRDEVTCR